MGKLLGRDDILNADDFKYEDVEVPEWGGTVRVKALTGTERDAYEESIMRRQKDGQYIPNLANARAKLVVAAMVDEEGKNLFTLNDVLKLGTKSSVALQRVFSKAQELAGLSADDLDELVGNSDTVQSEGSTSD